MTKLTTERLEYYAELPAAPAERKAIFMYEVRCMARQLLAYEQAAKNPVAWVVGDEEIADFKNGREVCVMRDCDDEQLDYLPLYAAPVLPKQSELMSIGELLHRLEEQTGEKWVEESAQPVMAEQWRSFVTDADIAALHRFVECCDDPESGGHDLEKEQVQRLEKVGALQRSGRISYITDFGDYLISATAPINAQQNEPQNIPENILAQPVSNPYKFLDERAKYRIIIEGFSNSRSVDFEACSQEEAEEIGRDIFHEECNYGVERLESIPAQGRE
ncbi:hypothetical protein [Hafnia paralvei]|uniref:hypothetical protein n=1 Tax=Hafnia paralvei TaxID=546367 RepID=UPI00211BA8CE|nr:hypothetical protein [Hafnia paralvei]